MVLQRGKIAGVIFYIWCVNIRDVQFAMRHEKERLIMGKRSMEKQRNKGFTLIELVIVVAILAILVGILAPQYTKYVEKSRKAADANNMEELVKAIQMYAIDGEHQLTDETIEIIIGPEGGTSTTDMTAFNSRDLFLIEALNKQFPDWQSNLHTKSKSWGNGKKGSAISAEITVQTNGTLSIEYHPDDFAKYMGSGN